MLTKAAILTLVGALGTCDLPAGDLKDPHYWGQVFLDKYEVERTRAVEELEPGPPPLAVPRTVLLVTGVTIPAEWFDPIALRLERDGFRPVVYEPPDLLSGSLFHNAHLLAQEVDRVRALTGEDKIDILAECTGGVIARHYIQALGGDRHVRRVVSFISPHHGVDKAPAAAAIAGWPALHDLSPGSEFRRTVTGTPLPDDVAFTSIYTCTDEYIQPYQTSIVPGATNIGLCDRKVGHFQFFYDPAIYLLMHGALTAPVADDEIIDPADPSGSDGGSGGCAATGGASGGAGALLLLLAAIAVTGRRRRAVRR